MQHTGQVSEKRSYRVVLLLIVGLAAFSSAMKELNQVHELTLQTGQLVAQWTGSLAPEKNEMLVKVDSCDSKILVPSVSDLPPLPPVPDVAVPDVLSGSEEAAPEEAAPVEIDSVVPAPLPHTAPPAPAVPPTKPRRVVRMQREAAATAKVAEVPEVKVFVSTDEMVDVNKALKDAFQIDVNQKAFKAKNRRHIWIGPEGRDVILKTLNRSINLRTS